MSGPRTKIPALIVFTKEYDANVLILFFLIMTEFLILFFFILKPNDFIRSNIVSMSLTLGKFLISTGSSKSIDAAKIGSDAFLLPDSFIVPLTLQGPLIENLSIFRL